MTCCNGRCLIIGAAALITVAGTFAFAQDGMKKPTKPDMPAMQDGQGEMPLPPGWTAEDMQKCMAASMPGEQHEWLLQGAGVWHGDQKMWMAPDTEPMTSEVTTTLSPFMDGHYVKCEIEGDMGDMGPFNGFGIYGFDNVDQQFVCTWIDNHGTGIMNGTGKRSSDGDSITWTYNYTCPINGKPAKMTETQKRMGPDTTMMTMMATDPHSGKMYKMLECEMHRTARGMDAHASAAPGMISDKEAEAGCAMCNFHMSGVKSCTPAVMIDGKPYLVDGATNVNFHEFCRTGAEPATVWGKIVDGKFFATKVVVKEDASH